MNGEAVLAACVYLSTECLSVRKLNNNFVTVMGKLVYVKYGDRQKCGVCSRKDSFWTNRQNLEEAFCCVT